MCVLQAEAGYETLAEVRKELTRCATAHKKARGDGEDDPEPAADEPPKEYPLLAFADADLDPEQVGRACSRHVGSTGWCRQRHPGGR